MPVGGLLGMSPKYTAAVSTLDRLGYTYHGGQLWKPPLGSPPTFGIAAATAYKNEKGDTDLAIKTLNNQVVDKKTAEEIGLPDLIDDVGRLYGITVKYVTIDDWNVWYAWIEAPKFNFEDGTWDGDWWYEIGYDEAAPEELISLPVEKRIWEIVNVQ